jgi:hypothetical protein
MGSDSICSVIASRNAVAQHAPWRRFEVDAQSWSAIGKALGEGGGELVSLWGDAEAVHMAVRTPPAEPCVISLRLAAGRFPSIGAQAIAGSRDREQHRCRLPAVQQIVQLLLFRT